MWLFILSKIFLYFTSKKKLKSVLSMTEIKRQRHRFPHLLEIRPDAPAPIRMYPRISSHNRNCHWHPGCILQKKPQVPNPTRQEAWHPIHNSRGKPSSMPQKRLGLPPLFKVHRNAEIDVRNREKPWGSRLNLRWGPTQPCSDLRWIPRRTLQLESRSDFAEET